MARLLNRGYDLAAPAPTFPIDEGAWVGWLAGWDGTGHGRGMERACQSPQPDRFKHGDCRGGGS